MKATFLILLTFLMGKGCDEEKAAAMKQKAPTRIEYTATTRGFYRNIIAEGERVSIFKERTDKEIPQKVTLSESQQKNIMTAFGEINLEEMPNLKAPSEKRFFDGAPIATLKITHDGKLYESQPFDHRNPPAGIAKLVNIMAEYTKDE